ncbi:hypothetical protein Micbo1qcDRAFT_224623 [Microdochium bolleyi]|uniref:Uncharacterized protein n=1 Tax=Microdochium bolleyi TaxID=196109 RepID=A0A136J5E5_9PEZI|nr:hypothetical protein Micbo1qcDRAFT_224623 [Microdochium bolleyi]
MKKTKHSLKNKKKNSNGVELQQEGGCLQLPVQEELQLDCHERPPPLMDSTRAFRLGTMDDVPPGHHQQKIYAFPGQLSSSLHTHDETTGRCNLHTLCSGTYIHGKGNRGWYCVTAPHVISRQLPRGCEGPGIVYALPGCVEVGHVAVKHDSLEKWFVVIKVCGSFQVNQLQKMSVSSDGGSQAGFLRGYGKSILAVSLEALEDDSASKAGSPGEELRMWVQPGEHLPLGTPQKPCTKTSHLRAKETLVHDPRVSQGEEWRAGEARRYRHVLPV